MLRVGDAFFGGYYKTMTKYRLLLENFLRKCIIIVVHLQEPKEYLARTLNSIREEKADEPLQSYGIVLYTASFNFSTLFF